MLRSRSWSEIAAFHWIGLAGFSRLKSRLQTRAIGAGISARSLGWGTSIGGRTRRSSRRFYGFDTSSRLYRVQVLALFTSIIRITNYRFNGDEFALYIIELDFNLDSSDWVDIKIILKLYKNYIKIILKCLFEQVDAKKKNIWLRRL